MSIKANLFVTIILLFFYGVLLEHLNQTKEEILTSIRSKRHNTNNSTLMTTNNCHKRSALNTTTNEINQNKKQKRDINNLPINPSIEFDTVQVIQNIRAKRSTDMEEINSDHKEIFKKVKNFFDSLTPEQKNEINKIKTNKMLTRVQIEEQIEKWAEKQPENIKVKNIILKMLIKRNKKIL